MLRGLFAADYIAALDGSTEIKGGWVNHNYIQLGYQASNSAIGFVYAFVVTYVLLYLMNCLPGLALRVSEEAELRGIDEAEIGQFAYDYTMRHDVELADSIQQECDRDEIRL
jgi:Amt family ammonium transporter